MSIESIVRDNIQRLRTERGLSYISLAEASGISANHVGHILRGEHAPCIGMLDKIAKGLDVPISELVELKK